MSVYTHVTVGSNDLTKARQFYDIVLGQIGLNRLVDLQDNGSIWGEKQPAFFVLRPADGAAATVGNGVTISFQAPSRQAVANFHAAAISAGGRCEGLPGPRSWAPNAYAAYARDPDGNKLAVYCFEPA
ncbi:MAG: VOC family protein [Pseudomonas sp.]|nr:VOC family protein [Pseudomonas sp.]